LIFFLAGPPVVYQVFDKKDVPKFSPSQPLADLAKYCQNSKEIADTSQLIAKQIPVNHNKIFLNEYSAVRGFLRRTLSQHKDSEVVRVASYSHAMGPIMLGNFTLDGALVLKDLQGLHTFYLIQYNDSWTHGCSSTCTSKIHRDEQKQSQSIQKMEQLDHIAKIIQNCVNTYKLADKLHFKNVAITNCDYVQHKIPTPQKEDLLLQQSCHIKQQMSHDTLVQKILSRELQGFLGK
jgi:hypothetical protein